ncbi:mucin-12-like [Ranitomeya imitator]|uniref:mucin-12-like n=1 Tax=Ranitomeya imitator TaxID=111125 RepID=UPI0037E7DBE7
MIRFLLLLLLLPGAELLANDTYEVESFRATTLGSQFTMAVTTQTPLRKPSGGSRAPTKKTPVHSPAPKNDKLLDPLPLDPSTVTDQDNLVQGGRVVNTTNLRHKNSTHHKGISSTQNTTHLHPTKMPVTAKSYSSIKKPIRKVPTPHSKLKNMMKTTMKNPSARYQSPPHVHHKNVTMRPGIGHFHHSNSSAGVAEMVKPHRSVTPLRNSLQLGQKNISPVADRLKHLPLGSQLNKQLKDEANGSSTLLRTVINNSSQAVTHNINHITHSLPNTSFINGKKKMLYELNSLNTSERAWRTENMSLVPQIDRTKDLATPELLKEVSLHLPGARQSEIMKEFNSKVAIMVPNVNGIYNQTKENLQEAELSRLGQDRTIQLESDKISSEPLTMGTVINETQRASDIQTHPVEEATEVWSSLRATTQSKVQVHNTVEQQYQTRPELTTGGHIHRNQTHSHKHHKHSLLGEHNQTDNTVSQHTATSPARLAGTNKHHRHLHNFTHPHEHNEHWVQHQISSTQVSLDHVGKKRHPSQSPLRGEIRRFHTSQGTVNNGSNLGAITLAHLRKNLSEPETATSSPWMLFTTVEPKSTTQSLQNLGTLSQLPLQTQRVFLGMANPHMLNSSEHESLQSPYPKVTIKPITHKHLQTKSTFYNTTEEFSMELNTQTQPMLTSHVTTNKKTEVLVHSTQRVITVNETELTTQLEVKLVDETQPVEPTQRQPDVTTHGSSYQSTQTYPDLSTEADSTKVRIGSSIEPLLNSKSDTETHPVLFNVTNPSLTKHGPPDLITLKVFNETHTKLSTDNLYTEPSTTPYSGKQAIIYGHNESQTDLVLNKTRSTMQTEPITKGNSEPTTPVTGTKLVSWTETELVTLTLPNTSNPSYPIEQTESITRTSPGWLEKTQTVTLTHTEPSTTNNSKSSTPQKMTTESYTEPSTQTQPITKGTTGTTRQPRRASITPTESLVKNRTETLISKTEPPNPTNTMGYSRDKTESSEPTSEMPKNANTSYGDVSPTHRGHLPSTQTQKDLETQTSQHVTRARSELPPTGDHPTSVPGTPGVSEGHVMSHTTAGPWSEISSPTFPGGHQSRDSGPTLSLKVPTFYPTRSHTSEKDHASGLTTVNSSTTESKSVTSPQSNTFTTQNIGEMMSVQPGRDRIFIVDEQQPVFKVQTLNVTYNVNMTHHAACEQVESCKPFLLQELTSAYKSTPGFDKIEILNVTVAGTAMEYKVLFSVRPGSQMSAAQELVLSDPSTLFESSEKPYRIYNTTLTVRHADPCADWFICPRSFRCAPLRKLSALCLSPCHSLFCHNNGICIHRKGQDPECQCPIGRDFWYMGQTCDYRMTHHRLAAIACAVVFCIIICAAAAVFILVRRFQTQILQQKVAQTQSSYRRFSRFDDVPTHFWCPSQTWLTTSASLNSLDNPAFSSSEEVFPLQALGSCVCGCQDGARNGPQTNQVQQPARAPPRLETSCSSVNDLMIDSGKASDVSVCSWPMEPIHWTPFPILHQLSLQSPFHARRPHSYFEGMELVNTERSWTA